MYQFMVAARNGSNVTHGNSASTGAGTDVGDISTMSLASGANKWASRAVVALQLAAWSAVGIVLLEKGVASLQSMPSSLNSSQEIPNNKSSIGNVSPDYVIPLDIPKVNSIEENGYQRGRVKIFVETMSSGAQSADGETVKTEMSDNEDRFKDKDNRSVDQSNNESLLQKVETQFDSDHNTVDENTSMPMKATTDNLKENNAVETEEKSKQKGRKRARFAKVVAGGAAAAAAMVAVGAVMLILGPAVIILRALDERRQERRFLKLSGEEDLPPSYEQATGDGEQAPTYSSLNLDTIVTSPPSVRNSTYHCQD